MAVRIRINQAPPFILIFFRPCLACQRFEQAEKLVALLDADGKGEMMPRYVKRLCKISGSRF